MGPLKKILGGEHDSKFFLGGPDPPGYPTSFPNWGIFQISISK